MKRTFIEASAVTKAFRDARLQDDALRGLQQDVMAGKGEVIKGTHGLRKIRCARAGAGKSGGLRVIFADFPNAGRCHLLAAFAKNTQENLDKDELQQLAALKAVLDRHYHKDDEDEE